MKLSNQDISIFRGLAGEVIYGFISLSTIASAIPVMSFFLIFGFILFYFIPDYLFPLHVLLMYMLSAIAVSRFALPAARGELNCGWFNKHIEKGETIAFAIRYVILTLVWGIPCGILIYIAGQMGGNAMMGSISLTSMGFSGLIMLIVGVIMIFAPTMSFIICTATSEPGEVLSIQPWRELLGEEFPNLVVFYASMFGGVLSFWLIYAIPLGIIIGLLSLISRELAGTLGVFILSLPATMAPILIGRLAGAMVLGSQHDFAEDNDEPNASINPSKASHVPPPPKPSDKPQPPLSTANIGSAPTPDLTAETNITNFSNNQTNPKTSNASQTTPLTLEKSVADSGLLSTATLQAQPESIEQKLLKKIELIRPYQLHNAITISNSRLKNRPDDPLINAETAIIKGRANEQEGLIELASKAIQLNLPENNKLLIINILQSIGNIIQTLQIEPQEYKACATLLTEFKLFYLSAICLTKTRAAFNTETEQENSILNLAMTANKQKKQKETVAILRLFQQHFPNSKHIPKVSALLQQASKQPISD